MKLCLIGCRNSGKSHFAALLYLHLQRIAGSRRDIHITPLIGDPSHNVIANASSLKEGEPLPPTPTPRLFEDHFIISFPRLFGEKTVDIAVVDTMGELIEMAMKNVLGNQPAISYREFEERLKELGVAPDDIRTLHENIFKADAYVFIINIAAEAKRSDELEKYRTYRIRGADVEYVFFLQNLFKYREFNRFGPIAGAAIVLTKYDKIMDMPLTLPEGMSLEQYLVNKYVSGFRAALDGWLRRYSKRKDLPIFLTWTMMDETGKRFQLVEDRQGFVMPRYPEETFDKFINWVKSL